MKCFEIKDSKLSYFAMDINVGVKFFIGSLDGSDHKHPYVNYPSTGGVTDRAEGLPSSTRLQPSEHYYTSLLAPRVSINSNSPLVNW